jgi:F-type H+-transporting ATPase subunit delta
MSTELIVRNWAQAFFNAAQDTGKLDAAQKDLALLTQVLKSEAAFLVQLSSPRLSLTDRSNILKKALSAHISDLSMNFLNLVIKYKRQNLLLKMLEEFSLINSQHQKILKATLTSATELDASQKSKLQDELQRKTGCTPDIQYRIDPRLLAGFILVYEDKMYDCSTKSALGRLKRILEV